MKVPKKGIIAAFLLLTAVFIHWYSGNENRVESGYSSHLSPWISGSLRQMLGWLPFSLGDLFYGLLVIWLVWKFFRFLVRIFKKGHVPSRKEYLISSLYKTFVFCSCMYIGFNVLWGINYNRRGIATQLGLEMTPYTQADLEKINYLLLDKVNESKKSLVRTAFQYPGNRELFKMVDQSYNELSNKFPYLQYNHVSLKSSMWGWLGNYTGFTGYYNPFTGEAQVNTTVPKFLHPFIACHEVGHQLGYAKEMEANFVGYLAASSSKDTLLHYSVYLDLFTYANRNLFVLDSVAAKNCRKALDTTVKADIKEWILFNRRHQSPVEPIIRWIYGKYLENNKQPQGLLSYDEVTAFIIAYYKKFGKI